MLGQRRRRPLTVAGGIMSKSKNQCFGALSDADQKRAAEQEAVSMLFMLDAQLRCTECGQMVGATKTPLGIFLFLPQGRILGQRNDAHSGSNVVPASRHRHDGRKMRLEMTTTTRAEAVQEFGSDRVEAAEMVILVRNDRPNMGEQIAHIGEKHWRFTPRLDQHDTMVANR